jgi:hypothetical protein
VFALCSVCCTLRWYALHRVQFPNNGVAHNNFGSAFFELNRHAEALK